MTKIAHQFVFQVFPLKNYPDHDFRKRFVFSQKDASQNIKKTDV
jgi:hypothetical protein